MARYASITCIFVAMEGFRHRPERVVLGDPGAREIDL
jgi:hypothetical protein